MSFDPVEISATIAARGPVARVVVAEVAGSAPREAGTSMLVWADADLAGGQSGTIGGGTLEWLAVERARLMLAEGTPAAIERLPLGPRLGQCCGGAVTLVTEVIDTTRLATLTESAASGWIARPVTPEAAAAPPPLALHRTEAGLRNGSATPTTRLVDGWLIEPLAAPRHRLWVYGAGHVGRALVSMFAPLPDWEVTWIDTAPERFPDPLPWGVTRLVAVDPARAVAYAPADAHHLILTYSHELDLALCHAVLLRDFGSAGLIGSTTKWSRFRKRLRQLGHADAAILRITCPIGDPRLGKHPQAIAISTAAALLAAVETRNSAAMDRSA